MKYSALLALVAAFSFALGAPRVGFGPGLQDWDYITVRPGAHMFYWLYYTTARVPNYTDRPLIIFLHGGPGSSTVGNGNFLQVGTLDYTLQRRNQSWVDNYNVLYIDNPVGTGFSFVESEDLICKDFKEIAVDMVEFLRQFYRNNPEFVKVPVHIHGVGSGAKMIAEIAVLAHEAVQAGSLEMNLDSIGLGGPALDDIATAATWPLYLFELGLVDVDGFKRIEDNAKAAKELADAGKWFEATDAFFATLGSVGVETAGTNIYNILTPPDLPPMDEPAFERFMNGPVAQVLGTNVTWKVVNRNLFEAVQADYVTPKYQLIERLLDETDIKVAIYSGQFSVTCSGYAASKLVNSLNWHGRQVYIDADRVPLVADGYIQGYVRKHENLYNYWILNAGQSAMTENRPAMAAIFKEIIGF